MCSILGIFGLQPDDAAYPALQERLLAHYEQNICHATVLFPGIDELLKRLEDLNLPWGIITNKRSRYTEPLVQALQLHERAITVVSGDTAGVPKPAPEPMLHACQAAGVSPVNCWYVGDDLREHGQRGVGVRRHRHAGLVHQRQQPEALQRYRLAARVGSGDDEAARLPDVEIERHDARPRCGELCFHQRVARLAQLQAGVEAR